ncbi:hypothetical protein POM88_021241 [Heracleum sosnowskyi]|uniref:Uncharacterized protein n=1 Tax=Heracleum sosnowskyi TaxID=360622 RepID=A0AAD8MSA7_9APIA|nr:hypothetical protein POM88_021241 [Heracleum sosnowskyi]
MNLCGKISTSMLSPNTSYVAYLMVDFAQHKLSGIGDLPLEACVRINGGKNEKRTVYIPLMPAWSKFDAAFKRLTGPQYPRKRTDGWSEIELGEYFNKEGGNEKLCISLNLRLSEMKRSEYNTAIGGMGIRPKS